MIFSQFKYTNTTGNIQEKLRKIKKLLHPTLLFNNIPLNDRMFQKHLCSKLDVKLNFSEHIKTITQKISEIMSVNFNQFLQGHLFSLYIKHL